MAGQTPQLAIVQVNDTVPGTVPRISGPNLVLTSNGTGDAAAWASASGGGERWTLGLDALDQVYSTDTTDTLYYSVEPSTFRVALIAEPTAGSPQKIRITCGYAAGTNTVTPRRNINGTTFSIAGRGILVGPRSGNNPYVDLQYINGNWQAVATAWNP